VLSMKSRSSAFYFEIAYFQKSFYKCFVYLKSRWSFCILNFYINPANTGSCILNGVLSMKSRSSAFYFEIAYFQKSFYKCFVYLKSRWSFCILNFYINPANTGSCILNGVLSMKSRSSAFYFEIAYFQKSFYKCFVYLKSRWSFCILNFYINPANTGSCILNGVLSMKSRSSAFYFEIAYFQKSFYKCFVYLKSRWSFCILNFYINPANTGSCILNGVLSMKSRSSAFYFEIAYFQKSLYNSFVYLKSMWSFCILNFYINPANTFSCILNGVLSMKSRSSAFYFEIAYFQKSLYKRFVSMKSR